MKEPAKGDSQFTRRGFFAGSSVLLGSAVGAMAYAPRFGRDLTEYQRGGQGGGQGQAGGGRQGQPTGARQGEFKPIDSEKPEDLIKRIAVACRVIGYWYNLVGVGHLIQSLGMVSTRVPGRDDQFYVKGASYVERPAGPKAWMIRTTPESIVISDMNGRKVGGPPGTNNTGEPFIFASTYLARKDVKAICHAHGHYTVLASVLGLSLKPMENEGLELFEQPIPTFKNNLTVGTADLGHGLVAAMGTARVCLMRGHGAVTVGETPEEAVMQMMRLEEQARLNVLAYQTMGPTYPGIPEEDVERYAARGLGAGEKLGLRTVGSMVAYEYLASLVTPLD